MAESTTISCSLKEGTVLKGATTISFSIGAGDSSSFDLFIDDELKGSSYSKSFCVRLDSTKLPDGWHNLVVRLNQSGGIARGLTLPFDVANRPPKIESLWVSPGIIRDSFSVCVRAGDPSGLKGVSVYDGRRKLACRYTAPFLFRFNSKGLINGLHNLRVCAVDVGGNFSIAQRRRSVFNVYRETIGYSIKKKPIVVYHLGVTCSNNKTLLVGAYHGSEWRTTWLLSKFIGILSRRADILKRGEIVILPCLNPDGLAARTRWNARHVDLNRNFPVRWGGPGVTGPGGRFYPGKRPFSEPETRALKLFLNKHKFRKFISYHSDLKLIYSNSPLGRMMSAATGYRFGDVGYPTPGSAQQWVKKEYPEMIYVLVELPGGRVSMRLLSTNFRALVAAIGYGLG